ncbi:MAG: hypothetical protein KBD90_02915, partial [Alphaproteobacteria bacterium]|nr:hypothetical protein [Alphaproteobacteria bacterium]
EFNENIDLLSSVKYEVDFNLNPEVQQNFRKLEILRHVVLYYLKDIELKKTKDKTPHLKESLLSILETFIFHVNKFKEKNMIKNKKLSEILSLDIFPFSIKLLSTKNQLEKKYNLLEELGKDEEAEAVYQEYKKEAKRQKDLKEEKKKESLKSQKTTSKGKIIKQRVEMKKNKKENLEKSSQQSRDMVEKNKKDRPQPSYNHQNTSTYVLSNDKFIISNNTKKEKRKNEIDHNHVNEKEEKKRNRKIGIKTNQDLKKEDKFIKNSVLVSNNENYKTKEENSKDRFYSKKAEKLSPNAKDILDTLFAPYYGKDREGGKIKWGQLEIPQRDIETLLESADFELKIPKGTSHHKIYKKGESNHLGSMPFHDGFTKFIYLRKLSELLARKGFYPQDLKDKLKKDGII